MLKNIGITLMIITSFLLIGCDDQETNFNSELGKQLETPSNNEEKAKELPIIDEKMPEEEQSIDKESKVEIPSVEDIEEFSYQKEMQAYVDQIIEAMKRLISLIEETPDGFRTSQEFNWEQDMEQPLLDIFEARKYTETMVEPEDMISEYLKIIQSAEEVFKGLEFEGNQGMLREESVIWTFEAAQKTLKLVEDSDFFNH